MKNWFIVLVNERNETVLEMGPTTAFQAKLLFDGADIAGNQLTLLLLSRSNGQELIEDRR